jgi:hypothetical protein
VKKISFLPSSAEKQRLVDLFSQTNISIRIARYETLGKSPTNEKLSGWLYCTHVKLSTEGSDDLYLWSDEKTVEGYDYSHLYVCGPNDVSPNALLHVTYETDLVSMVRRFYCVYDTNDYLDCSGTGSPESDFELTTFFSLVVESNDDRWFAIRYSGAATLLEISKSSAICKDFLKNAGTVEKFEISV